MLKISKIILLFAIFILPDYYILDPSYRFLTICLVLVHFSYVIDNLFIKKHKVLIHKDTWNILIMSLLFLLYIYISDVIKNDPVEAAKFFYPTLLIPLLLITFESRKSTFNLHKYYILIFGITIFFAIMQIFGFTYTLSALIPNLGFLQADDKSYLILIPGTGLRVVGATFNLIGFAEYLCILIIILYFRFIKRRTVPLLVAIIILIVVLFFTQTRSALYGLVPSIALVHFIYAHKDFNRILKMAILVIIMLSIMMLFFTVIEMFFYRLTTPFDASALERFQTNYYAMLGVLDKAPIFGIPREMAWEIISEKAAEIGLVFGDRIRITTTHHFQILFYFRYYGFIGVALLVLLYYMIFRKIIHLPHKYSKMMILSIFIFDLQYSVGHNNKLISNIILWVILACMGGGIQWGKRKTNNTPDNHSVQIESHTLTKYIKVENNHRI